MGGFYNIMTWERERNSEVFEEIKVFKKREAFDTQTFDESTFPSMQALAPHEVIPPRKEDNDNDSLWTQIKGVCKENRNFFLASAGVYILVFLISLLLGPGGAVVSKIFAPALIVVAIPLLIGLMK